MSRILLTWELGLNFGHLARLLPIARQLKSRGHAVLVAARELTSAARVLGPHGISFVQAPYLAESQALPHRPTGYADVLRAQGWGDRFTLRGLTEGWINLYRMFRPDMVVADYSPTAVLAAHWVGVPYLPIGNGFELPPATSPLPHFPGFSWATPERAAQSEAFVLENALAVGQGLRGQVLEYLAQIVAPSRALFATFPELDHYCARADARYIGPLVARLGARQVPWPQVEARTRKVFVCVRPDTENRDAILGSLRPLDASVICVALGFQAKQLEPYRDAHVTYALQPIDVEPLTRQADVCLSYGAEGTVASFLLAGVAQVLSPYQVEAHMAARRIAALGAGVVLRSGRSASDVLAAVQTVLEESQFKSSAQQFAARHTGSSDGAARHAVQVIELAASGGQDSPCAKAS